MTDTVTIHGVTIPSSTLMDMEGAGESELDDFEIALQMERSRSPVRRDYVAESPSLSPSPTVGDKGTLDSGGKGEVGSGTRDTTVAKGRTRRYDRVHRSPSPSVSPPSRGRRSHQRDEKNRRGRARRKEMAPPSSRSVSSSSSRSRSRDSDSSRSRSVSRDHNSRGRKDGRRRRRSSSSDSDSDKDARRRGHSTSESDRSRSLSRDRSEREDSRDHSRSRSRSRSTSPEPEPPTRGRYKVLAKTKDRGDRGDRGVRGRTSSSSLKGSQSGTRAKVVVRRKGRRSHSSKGRDRDRSRRRHRSPSPPKSAVGEYSIVGQPRGLDFRGLPTKYYMGIEMYDYDRIDVHTRKLLKIELETRQQAVSKGYEDLTFRSYPDDASPSDLTLMHYEYYAKNKLAEARTNAIKWQQGIIGISSFVEVAGGAMGLPLQDMTNATAKVLPFTQSIVLDLAQQEGTPMLLNLVSPKVQFISLFVINGLFFVWCKSVKLPESMGQSSTYNILTGLMGEAYKYFAPQAAAAAPGGAAAQGAGAFAAPADAPPATAPAAGAGGIIQGLMGMAGNVMSAIQGAGAAATAGGGAAAQAPTQAAGRATAAGRRAARAGGRARRRQQAAN